MELDSILDALRTARPGGVGIRDWALFASDARRLSLGIKDREVGNAHAPLSLSEGCSGRYRVIWEDGLLSRGSLERRQLEVEPLAALEDARAAAYDDPDAAHVLGPAPIPHVELYADAAAGIADGNTDLLAERLERVRRNIADHGFRTWSGSFGAGASRSRLITSAGLDVTGRGTSAGWHITINGEIGDGFGARAPESDAEFDRRLDRLMRTAHALEPPAEPMAGDVHPVILHPGVVEDFVIDTLLSNLGGSTVAHGDGHFRREQFGSGEPVLREDITLRMDPLQPLKGGSYRFTSEGVPAARCTYVDRGRLVTPVLDVKYARRLGLEPTPPPHGMDALYLEGPEPLSERQGLEAARGGVLVLSVLGVHTQDSSSGDFSLSAPQVLRIGAEGYAGRLRGTISGNVFEVLSGDDLRFVDFEGEHTPGLLFPCRFDPK